MNRNTTINPERKEIATAFFEGEYEEYELAEILCQDNEGNFFIDRSFCGEWSVQNLMRMNWAHDNHREFITEEEAKSWVKANSNQKIYSQLFGKDNQKEEKKQILYFWLHGILQCWPEKDDPYSMKTSRWPTKSGICEHIIGNAMGLSIDSEKIGQICQSIEIGIKQKLKQNAILIDWEQSCHPAMNNMIEYLQDTSFLVAITADEKLLQDISDALRYPDRVPVLGCDGCGSDIPIIPFVTDKYSSIEKALTNLSVSFPNSLDPDEHYTMGRREPELIQLESKHGETRYDVRKAVSDMEYTTRHVVTKVIN